MNSSSDILFGFESIIDPTAGGWVNDAEYRLLARWRYDANAKALVVQHLGGTSGKIEYNRIAYDAELRENSWPSKQYMWREICSIVRQSLPTFSGREGNGQAGAYSPFTPPGHAMPSPDGLPF